MTQKHVCYLGMRAYERAQVGSRHVYVRVLESEHNTLQSNFIYI